MVNLLDRIRRTFNAPAAAPVPRPYRILYTRGDELITPQAYRGAFEQALGRGLPNTGDVSDGAVQRAYAVSTTAFSCTEYRASVTGGIPLEVISGVKGADEAPLQSTPFDTFLSNAPRLLADWTRSHLIFGRSYIRKRYNSKGYPTGLVWLNPQDVMEETSGNIVTSYRWLLPGGGWERLELGEVIYSQAFDARSNGNGLSKFEAAWLSLNIEASVSTYAAAFFLNGAQPDGMLTFAEPLSDQQMDDAREEWRKNFRGAKNAHKTAVMPAGATWTPITVSPRELAMTELKGVEREDICAVFEVDPALVHLKDTGDALSANSTFNAIQIGHVRDVTLPFLRTVILPALNEQWALRDFGAPYRLDVDEQKIPALVEAQFVRSDSAVALSGGSVLDYDESRDLLGYAPREDYLKRKPDEALALWQAGAATLNDVHMMVSGRAPMGAQGEVMLIGGQLIPSGRILEVAQANVERLKTQPPPPTPLGGPDIGTPPSSPTPQLPGGAPAAPAVPSERTSDNSLCAMLYFPPNEPTLIGLQRRLQDIYAGQEVQWTPADEFHVTVFYAPDVTDVQAAQFGMALGNLTIPADLSLAVGSLHTFDNLGEHALHFRIRRSGALLEYQDAVFAAAQGIGILASPHSAPESYVPHITMGYVGERARAVTYSNGSAVVRPAVLRLMFGDTCVYEAPLTVPGIARSQALPLQLAVDLSGNQFVRYARRILSDALTGQGMNAEWVDEDAWRLVLASCEDWTPGALSALLKRADYADVGKLDARLNAFVQQGNGLYAAIDAQADTLVKSAALDLRAASLQPGDAPSGQAVLLAILPEGSAAPTLPPVDFPLVLSAIGCYIGGERYHAWALRSASAAQIKELANWEHVSQRKGAAYAFRSESLPRFVRDHVQVGLADGYAALVFVEARVLLNETRAYSGTRAEFQQAVEALIAAANADENSRREFASQMRTALRQYGLLAFRDGMEKGGYSPESFSAAEVATFRRWLDEQSGYVTNLGGALFKQGDTPDPSMRADLWGNASLDRIFFEGLSIGAPDKPATWRVGETEHCASCLANNGQTLAISEWRTRGMPRSAALDCGGFNCQCEILDEHGKRIGAR